MRITVKISILIRAAVLFTCISPIGAANTDSLEMALKNRPLSQPERLKLLEELSSAYASSNLNKAVYYATEGIKLSEKEKDHLTTGKLCRNAGIAYYMFSNFDSANIYLNKALEYSQQIGNDNLKLLTYSALGNVSYSKGNYPEAIDFYMKGIPLAEKEDNHQRLCILFANLSGIYTRIENWELAEKYLAKTIEIATKTDDIISLGQAYYNLSDVYLSREDYSKAIEYESFAIESFQKSGQKEFEGIATQGMAMLYYKMPTPDYQLAEFWAKKGLELSNQSALPRSISAAYCMLSNVYLAWHKNNLAEQYAHLAFQTDSTDSNINSNIFGNLVWTSIRKGDAEKATQFMNRYRDIIDKRATELYQSTISEMEVKYESQQKELHIKALLQQKRLYGIITIICVLILCLLVLILSLYYRAARQKRVIAEQKIAGLEQEKLLIATQAVLDGETAERSRLARDLHDGLGGMLSVVKLKFNNMKGDLIMQKSDIPAFHDALELLDNSISELRRVARNLMPESLKRYGLNAAISDFCCGIEPVRFHYFGNNQRHHEKIENTIFRITMELINNAIKHSHADQINVQLIDEGNRINLLVQDNGIGFSMDQVDTTKTSGLSSIRSRMEALGGSFQIISSPGNGTEANIDISKTEIL